MKEKYYAGFMQEKPSWMRNLPHLRRRVFVFLTDVITLLYTWMMVSYSFNIFSYHIKSFTTLPWWVMLIVVVEVAALWENFGVSLGMKLLGLRLADTEGGAPSLQKRALRYLTWHISGLPLVGLVLASENRAWHDRLSGLRVVRVDEVETVKRPWYRRSWSFALLVLLVVTLVAAMLVTRVDFVKFFTGAPKTGRIWRQFFSPEWSLLGDGVRLLIVTIFMAFMATLFGVLIAVPLSFLAARNLMRGLIGRLVYTIIRVTMSIIRSIEPIIWAIIFVVWVRVGAFPGVLALFVPSVADLTKLSSERLESIDPGPVEAIRATGANRIQVIMYGIIPQIINPYLSFTLYRWDINVRMATIIGIVGGGGIGQRLYQYTKLWRWSEASVMMLLIMLVVWAMDYTSSRLRARLD
jgi:phosphonate transport system permease protein